MKFIEELRQLINTASQNDDYKPNNYNQIQRQKYHKYPKSRLKNKIVTDYELGYKQAMSDLKKKKQFRTFPKNPIKAVKITTNDKAIEIPQFLKGYHDAKLKIK